MCYSDNYNMAHVFYSAPFYFTDTGQTQCPNRTLKEKSFARAGNSESAWPSVSYSDEPEDLPQGKRLKC